MPLRRYYINDYKGGTYMLSILGYKFLHPSCSDEEMRKALTTATSEMLSAYEELGSRYLSALHSKEVTFR